MYAEPHDPLFAIFRGIAYHSRHPFSESDHHDFATCYALCQKNQSLRFLEGFMNPLGLFSNLFVEDLKKLVGIIAVG